MAKATPLHRLRRRRGPLGVAALPRAPGAGARALDYFVLRYLFEDSFAIPVAGLLEEWLPIPVEFLPTATLAWCVQNLAAESEIAKSSAS